MAKQGRLPKKDKPESQDTPENTQEPLKTSEKEPKITQNPPEKPESEAKKEKKEKFLTIFEAAEHFKTSEAAINLWIEHGHLTKVRGGLIPMTSIVNCRFNVRA